MDNYEDKDDDYNDYDDNEINLFISVGLWFVFLVALTSVIILWYK